MSTTDKIIVDYLKSIQNNVNRLLQEREEDQLDIKKKWETVILELNRIRTENKLMTDAFEKATKTVKEETKNVVSSVEDATDELIAEMAGKTKIIEKTVEHVGLLKWLTKPFRKKVK